MELVFRHSGKYTAENINIDDVIASLEAQKELVEAGLIFLASLDRNFNYEFNKIRVQSIVTGSLSWDLLVQVYGTYQSQIEGRVVGGIEEVFGVDIPPEYEAIVTLAALAATYVVARYAYERVARSRGEGGPSIHISGDNNVIVQQIADVLNTDQAAVAEALDRSLPPSKRKRLIPVVANFLRPSKKEAGQKIELNGAPDITAETLQEFPNDAELAAVSDSANIDVEGGIVDIRGTDRDKHKQGWHAAIMDDKRFPKRLPMDLYPTVNPEALANHRRVKANLVVECERLPDDILKPKRIHLLSFEVLGED